MDAKTAIFALFGILIGLAALIASGHASARGDDVLTFRLGLNVPTICRVDLDNALPVSANTAVTAEEFCNAPAGYRVIALHPAPSAGTSLWFEYGGRRVQASASGMTTLAEEPTAAHRFRPLAIITPQQGQLAVSNITLQIVPR